MCRTGRTRVKSWRRRNRRSWSRVWRTRRCWSPPSRTQTPPSTQRQRNTVWRCSTSDSKFISSLVRLTCTPNGLTVKGSSCGIAVLLTRVTFCPPVMPTVIYPPAKPPSFRSHRFFPRYRIVWTNVSKWKRPGAYTHTRTLMCAPSDEQDKNTNSQKAHKRSTRIFFPFFCF